MRKEELEVRKFEAETRRLEILSAKERTELEYQAKKKELELREKNEAAQNEERMTMTRALLEFLQKK